LSDPYIDGPSFFAQPAISGNSELVWAAGNTGKRERRNRSTMIFFCICNLFAFGDIRIFGEPLFGAAGSAGSAAHGTIIAAFPGPEKGAITEARAGY
jgi:hypothetical protein